MSSRSTPQPSSEDASPSQASTPATTSSAHKATSSKSKPANVFSNDGSFLERFERTQMEEGEKKRQEEVLKRKRNFDNRFKNRGKRSHPDPSSSTATDPPAKKSKSDKPLTDYEKQVKSFAGRSLKDDGIGVRPLVK